MKWGFCFICNSCGYGICLSSGVPSECPICHTPFDLRRCTPEEYHKCETNDGQLESEKQLEVKKCL